MRRFWDGEGRSISTTMVGRRRKLGLGLKRSKKAKITLETIIFWQNISISTLNFFPFLYTMKACQWNLINFSEFENTVIRKEKKTLMQQSMTKEKLRKAGLCFITGCFIKSFNMIIGHFLISRAHPWHKFCFLISGWHKKYQ